MHISRFHDVVGGRIRIRAIAGSGFDGEAGDVDVPYTCDDGKAGVRDDPIEQQGRALRVGAASVRGLCKCTSVCARV